MNQASQALVVVVVTAGSILPSFTQTPLPPSPQNSPKTAVSVEQIEDQIKKHPGDPRMYVGLGLAFWQQHDFPHALEAFQLAVKFGPRSAEAHNWLGVASLEKGDFTGSIAEFRRAIALDPKYARAYANLGSALN